MEPIAHAKRIVIKIGSALLVDTISGQLRSNWLYSLAQDVADLRKSGKDIVLVSSGSIALGRGVLKLPMTQLSLEQSQAAAAVGQIQLARAYQEYLAPHNLTTAQILVTLEDSADRRRYLNSRATMEMLLSLGVVPIVNENDTVATDEIRYGDNDRLAAQVAVTVGADLLILLSDVDGLYSANPKEDPQAKRFEKIDVITPQIEAMAGDAGSGLSKGGMKTKLMAAKTATTAGCAMIIGEGSLENPVSALSLGANFTFFSPQLDPQAARKRWISSMKPLGIFTLDNGAVRALEAGKSLLPAGVVKVDGKFNRGDAIELHGPDGVKIAQGISAYSSADADAIKGCKSTQIEGILGYQGRSVLVHRDDMAI